jgi:hypothetical protein
MKKNNNDSKQMLFEMMHKVSGMPLRENHQNINYPKNIEDLREYIGHTFVVLDTIEDFGRLTPTYYKKGEEYELKNISDSYAIPTAHFKNKYEQHPETGEYSYSANIKVDDVLNKMTPK